MNVLGIETSCDETAASVVQDGRFVFSNVIASSLKEHAAYGGVIPEIASRRQLECINAVVKTALKKAGKSLKDIDVVAVTQSPGLIGSLLVGTSFAQSLAFAIQKPLISVDHIKAHVYANFLVNHSKKAKTSEMHLPSLPAIGLIVSGGHTALYHVKSFDSFQLVGQTRDDAVGEAFDKVARILGLGYPGGPIIDKMAREATRTQVHFPCAKLPGSFDFSFSGIKTSVLNYKRLNENQSYYSVKHVASAFQKSVVAAVIEKSLAVCLQLKIKTLLIGGGVAANSYLRQELQRRAEDQKIKVYFPAFEFCIDNAAMIAGLGYHLLKKN